MMSKAFDRSRKVSMEVPFLTEPLLSLSMVSIRVSSVEGPGQKPYRQLITFWNERVNPVVHTVSLSKIFDIQGRTELGR